jgi:hypothetical protein
LGFPERPTFAPWSAFPYGTNLPKEQRHPVRATPDVCVNNIKKLARIAPDAMRGFEAFEVAAFKKGAIPRKYKELMAEESGEGFKRRRGLRENHRPSRPFCALGVASPCQVLF